MFAAILVWSTLAATPAFATLHRDDGDDPGKQISKLKALLVFVGIPVGLMVLIALLVLLPSLAKGPRYRLGEEWRAIPEWYGAPREEPAVEAGEGHPALEREAAVTGTVMPSDAETQTGDGGGSSARW